jgi:hypothetical protein
VSAPGGTGTVVPTGFTIRLPENWYDLSVVDEADENEIARRVWERCQAAGLDEQRTGQFTATVRRSVRQARESGAVHAGGTFELYEDGLLVAAIVVAKVTPPANGDVIAALLAVGDTAAPSGTWYRVGTAQIPGIGTVARVHGVQDVTYDGETIRTALMQTVLRLPGSSDVLVVSASSPNIAEADELFELFAAITETLRLHTGEDDEKD